jgi:dihydroorotase
MSSTILREGQIITSEHIITGDVYIEDGKIAEIAPSITRSADQEFDCRGLQIFPGMIDTHVHFRDAGLTHKGDATTESKAALAGGVTTICDMPNTIPQTLTVELVKQKQQLYADF